MKARHQRNHRVHDSIENDDGNGIDQGADGDRRHGDLRLGHARNDVEVDEIEHRPERHGHDQGRPERKRGL